jgi:hypothetical protein
VALAARPDLAGQLRFEAQVTPMLADGRLIRVLECPYYPGFYLY